MVNRKKIDKIAGMSDMVKSLYDAGKVPRKIREELLKKYPARNVPTISVIYSYINDLGKHEADLRVKLTGSVQRDARLIVNSFDALMDTIFTRYKISFADKKTSQVDLDYFKAQLELFVDEAVSSYDKFNKVAKFHYLYWANEVILPLLFELNVNPKAQKKIMKKLEKADKECENIDIDKVIGKYT